MEDAGGPSQIPDHNALLAEAALPQTNLAAGTADDTGDADQDELGAGDTNVDAEAAPPGTPPSAAKQLYLAYLEITKLFKERLQAAERVPSGAIYVQALDAEVTKAEGMEPDKRGTYLEAKVSVILERLRSSRISSAEHALYKPLSEVVQKCRSERHLPPAKVHRHSVFTNPEALHGTAAHQALEKVSVDMMQKLSALHGRDVCEYLYLCVSKGLAGKVFVGNSPGLEGISECLHLPASVRAFLLLRGAAQRSASLTAFHDLSCEKLAVADQKLIVSIMFKVLAPGQRNDCPYKDEGNQAAFSDRYFAWPEGVPWRGISLQTSSDLIKLFDAAASFASRTSQWSQVMKKAYVSASDHPLVLQVLQSGANTAAKNARAPRDDAELVAASEDDVDQGGDVGASRAVGVNLNRIACLP